jgi:hypothetical protein
MLDLSAKTVELHQLMRCPVNWEADTLTENWEWSILHLDWLHCLEERIPDGSDIPVTPEEYDDLLGDPKDAYELDHLLINLRLRRPEAVELYMKRAGRLAGLTFMTPAEHGKHFRATVPKDEVAMRSKDGPSLFGVTYSSERLKSTFWTWFQMFFDSAVAYESNNFFVSHMIVYNCVNEPDGELYGNPVGKLWQKFLTLTNLRICMDTLRPVGACDGELTSFLCYDIHIDAKTAHCYPVSEAEAQRIMGGGEVVMNDSLNC